MKIFQNTFYIFFIAYLLVLSWQPCQDVADKAQIYSQTNIETAENQHQESENESDDCSPFCVCSCCQISVAYSNFGSLKIIESKEKITRKPIDFYKNPYEKNYKNEIWQPPKSQA